MHTLRSSHYYHPSQIPPSILQMHAHPAATTYEHQPQANTNAGNTNGNNSSQIPVIAAAAQALLEQNNAAAAALTANAFYRFQQPTYHQNSAMVQ
jgi:hypothetical protein